MLLHIKRKRFTMNHQDATQLRPEGDRILDAPFMLIDVPGYIKQIKQEDSYEENKRNAITLVKSSDMTVVLIALKKNAELTEHKAEGRITIQVLKGEVEFSTSEGDSPLKEGQLVTLHKAMMHSVKAKEKSVLLLTILGS
jgi:quercetin dioxygenase-like cupin family protein